MPAKKDRTFNGGAVDLLRSIWEELKGMRGEIGALGARIDDTNRRLDDTNGHLAVLAVKVDEGFARLDRRIDNLLLGAHGHEHAELRERVARLETHVGLSPAHGG